MSSPAKFLFVLSLGLAAVSAHAGLKPGDTFPSLAQAALNGDPLPADAGKVTLVDFWASWCAPCRASFPAYAKLNAEYASRGLVIVAVSVDQDPAAFADFRRRFHPPFVTVLDQAQQLVRAVEVPAMPSCYLIGRDNRIRFVHQGFHGAGTERELRQEIERLLAEPPSPS